MKVMYRKNLSFLEVRKTVKSFMKEDTYAIVARRMSLISNNQTSTKLLLKSSYNWD